jgi:peptidoglycan/xylan/chitin deacetylase (PgdA/CDA1 family)
MAAKLIAGMLALAALTHVSTARGPEPARVPILVYHRFGPVVSDSMTVRTSTFQWQLEYLREHRYTVIPLRVLIDSLLHPSPPLPSHSVVITADDGHESVFTDMLPVVQENAIPVTLFIYPSAISNASYAMTWAQLDALRDTGLFDIQSHTYWHPNFSVEKRRLTPAAYRAFATKQFCSSKDVLREKLGVKADLLAWPFGIHDDELEDLARECGYIAAFTLERRSAGMDARLMALPRFLMTDGAMGASFASMLPAEEDPEEAR